jgi:hypothetical protein
LPGGVSARPELSAHGMEHLKLCRRKTVSLEDNGCEEVPSIASGKGAAEAAETKPPTPHGKAASKNSRFESAKNRVNDQQIYEKTSKS